MVKYNHISQAATVFHTFQTLEEGASLTGYAALIAGHELSVPAPDYLCAIGTRHKKYDKGRWRLYF